MRLVNNTSVQTAPSSIGGRGRGRWARRMRGSERARKKRNQCHHAGSDWPGRPIDIKRSICHHSRASVRSSISRREPPRARVHVLNTFDCLDPKLRVQRLTSASRPKHDTRPTAVDDRNAWRLGPICPGRPGIRYSRHHLARARDLFLKINRR